MKTSQTIILVASDLGTTLVSRKSVSLLEEVVARRDCEAVVLDFSGVTFASRSFMDELYNSETLGSNRVRYVNLATAVSEVWNAVKQTQGKTAKRALSKVKTTTLGSVQALEEALDQLAYTF